MKILINRKPVEGPWGGGNHFIKAFFKYGEKRGHQIVSSLQPEIDAIFIHDPRYDELGISINEAIQYKRENSKVKIFQRINECDDRKGTTDVDPLLNECSKYIDHTFFVSHWMKSYHEFKGWKCKKTTVLINGVDRSIFKKNKKIENGKINLVTHHWSNNYLKGFDIYESLDDYVGTNKDFTFTYIGRHRDTFKNSRIVSPLFGNALGEELGKYDVYISASRFDPGPNHILESLACEIPTLSLKIGGGACEFTSEQNTYKNFSELVQILESKNFDYSSGVELRSWKECMDQCFKEIEC